MQINPINNSDSSRYTRPSFKQLIVDKELPLKLIGKVARNKEIAKLTEFLHKDGYDLHIYDYERLAFGFVAKKFELALYAKPIENGASKYVLSNEEKEAIYKAINDIK